MGGSLVEWVEPLKEMKAAGLPKEARFSFWVRGLGASALQWLPWGSGKRRKQMRMEQTPGRSQEYLVVGRDQRCEREGCLGKPRRTGCRIRDESLG